MKKLSAKRKLPNGSRRRNRTKTVTDPNKVGDSSGSGNDDKKPVQYAQQVTSQAMPPPMAPPYGREVDYQQLYQRGYPNPHNPSPPGGQQSDNGSTYAPPPMSSLVQPVAHLIHQNRQWPQAGSINQMMSQAPTQQPPQSVPQPVQQTQPPPPSTATNPPAATGGAQSVISEPPTQRGANYVPYGYYQPQPQQPQLNLSTLGGLGSLVPPNIQRGMEQGYGNDVAWQMACQLLQTLNRQQQQQPPQQQVPPQQQLPPQQQAPSMIQQQNINSLMGTLTSEISPYPTYNQTIPQQAPTQQQPPNQQLSQQSLQQQVQRQTQATQQANDGQPADQQTRNQQQQQQQPSGQQQSHATTQQQQAQTQQMKPPQQTHSQMNMLQQTRPPQVYVHLLCSFINTLLPRSTPSQPMV